MSFSAQRLYDLLPAIYRIRDHEKSESLRELLSVIAEQAAVLEENLEQLYDDQFIETCADWAVPYIGDLIGYRTLHGVAPKVGSPRAEVARTIAFRRRKGTAAMLEQLARDVTGWNARVVEFFQLLATTQYMNHIRQDNHYSPDLRKWEDLERLNSPFDTIAHTVDVRRISGGEGRYNIPNIGIFLWRLDAHSLTNSPAFRLDDRRYLFSPLGNNTPLFTRPETEDEITHLAEPLNVPDPVGRRILDRYTETYYGTGKSILLRINGTEVDSSDIVACNLDDAGGGTWSHQPQNKIAIDPVLGRIAFPENQDPPTEVQVTFHYGFSADMGGGEYERRSSIETLLQSVLRVPQDRSTIQTALDDLADGGGVVEITDSGRYEETLSIEVEPGKRLELRAANTRRPTLVLNGDIEIVGGEGAEVTLNGLLITGGTLRIPSQPDNGLRRLRLRHCTLVPGLSLTIGGEPEHPDTPNLIVESENVTVEIDHCIVGGLRTVESAFVRITDSIIDALDEAGVAYAGIGGESAGGTLHIVDSTVIGKVHARLIEMASNTIFLSRLAGGDTWSAPVRADRKQTGCVRFSYLPLSSIVPRRYRCQPAAVSDESRVRPQFTSLRYGDPGYGQLRRSAAEEIRTGADDEGEIGAFHKLYQPQREINLRVRLDEYLRFGLEAGILYVT
jgi:hypothetical protein